MQMEEGLASVEISIILYIIPLPVRVTSHRILGWLVQIFTIDTIVI